MTVLSFLLLAVIGIVVMLASNEGVWGAALILLCTLFAGILAMNLFEPLAAFLESGMPAWKHFWDFISLTVLFIGFVTGLRLAADRLAPTSPEYPAMVYDIGRFGFSLAAGYITMAFLLTALHTAPIGREVAMIGFKPEENNFFGVLAPDREWLAFNQYLTEKVLGSSKIFDGPQYAVPEVEKQFGGAKKGTWPSFTIRYASRREDYPERVKVKKQAPESSTGEGGGGGAGQGQNQPAPPAPGGGF